MADDVTVRDARPDDADAVSDLGDVPRGVAERLLRERRVRVAADGERLVGFLAYDVTPAALHLTWLAGECETVAALLEEPIAFARAEAVPVEAVVPVAESGALDAVANAGFESVGDGPMFDGERTRRFRLLTTARD